MGGTPSAGELLVFILALVVFAGSFIRFKKEVIDKAIPLIRGDLFIKENDDRYRLELKNYWWYKSQYAETIRALFPETHSKIISAEITATETFLRKIPKEIPEIKIDDVKALLDRTRGTIVVLGFDPHDRTFFDRARKIIKYLKIREASEEVRIQISVRGRNIRGPYDLYRIIFTAPPLQLPAEGAYIYRENIPFSEVEKILTEL